MLVARARQGQRVVRLKCGDPGIFGRAAEELSALAAAEIPVEIVPGVTSACAAAAASGTVLTERGAVDTLVLTTGHAEDGARAPAWLSELRPGTRVALYMAVTCAPRIAEEVARMPLGHAVEVDIVANAQRPDQQILRCAPAELERTLRAAGIRHTAILFLTLPLAAAARAAA
jgi:uroporphyrin-III C-methyltransferase/precorrin-2 dehydrogenase/sirohydrochlorin ferrochelatase